MATFTDLPNELKQEIINHLHHSVSFTSLSSISRSWFQYLVNRRFTRIQLNPQNISGFLVLLQSPLCTFRQNVRQLDIHWTSREIWRRDQEIIHAILTNPSTHHDLHSTQVDHPKSFLKKAKRTIKLSTPSIGECQFLNIVCLFPRLEHLQVQLMGITSTVPNFPGQPPISSVLKSISVICNSTPPVSRRQAKWVPPEWEHFLGWVRSNRIYKIQCLYLTCMAWWNYRAAETLIKLQQNALKHLHIGPQAREWVYDFKFPECVT
ncbi:hypothetical protein BDZ94DRAFT_696446 [Collybia nuda]|uniref:F-box domain-containing protein n=1 Tax=Collybia nuda TaxID=64659 RepID=A0A9P6CJD9_9AGAR|nr:hypothetical protein BDZ94DRAFT_696446 [Collybia nuda]